MKKSARQKFSIRFPSKTDNLEVIREFINSVAQKGGFDEEISDQIALAVDEACTNVIKHAHKYDSRRMIDVTVRIDLEKIEIEWINWVESLDFPDTRNPNQFRPERNQTGGPEL